MCLVQVFVAIASDLYPYKQLPMRELHLARASGADLVPVLLDFDAEVTEQRWGQWRKHWQQWEAAKPDFVTAGQYAANMEDLLSCRGRQVQAHEVDEHPVIYELANRVQEILRPGVHQSASPDHRVVLNIFVQLISGGSLVFAFLCRTFQRET